MRTLLVLAIVGVTSGCAGDDSIVVGPMGDAMYAKGGGSGSFNTPNADATIAGAVTTSSPQSVRAGINNPLEVSSAPQWSTVTATHFPNRMALGLSGCVVDPANAPSTRVNGLFSKFVDAEKPRQMGAYIDLSSLGQPSTTNTFSLHTTEGDSLFTRAVGPWKPLGAPPVTVTSPSPGVYVFSGGGLKITDRTGGASKHLNIVCPNVDEVTLTVVPR